MKILIRMFFLMLTKSSHANTLNRARSATVHSGRNIFNPSPSFREIYDRKAWLLSERMFLHFLAVHLKHHAGQMPSHVGTEKRWTISCSQRVVTATSLSELELSLSETRDEDTRDPDEDMSRTPRRSRTLKRTALTFTECFISRGPSAKPNS